MKRIKYYAVTEIPMMNLGPISMPMIMIGWMDLVKYFEDGSIKMKR